MSRRRDQSADFVAAEYDGQGTRKVNRTHLRHQLLSTERGGEEELQPGNRGVQRNRRHTAVNQMQLVAPQVLDGGSVRRASEKDAELSNDTKIVGLRAWREAAHAHVVHHAPA